MMTARQYADKYPGQAVRLAPKFAKEMGLKSDAEAPIGIIVGFKPGQKGIVGSSKVAIWHDKYDQRYGLEAKVKTTFHPVIPDPPAHNRGIYFLSVNCIELVKQLRDIPPYPHRCGLCGSPARNGATLVVCSNSQCKSKKKLLISIGPIPKFYTLDKDKYILCPTCQIKDSVQCRDHDLGQNTVYGQYKHLTCRKSGHKFTHSWKSGHKILYQGNHYIWENGQLVAQKIKGPVKKKG